jgi:hypothetical protein
VVMLGASERHVWASPQVHRERGFMPPSSFRTTFDGVPGMVEALSPSIEEKIKVVVDLWEVKVPTLTSQNKSNVWIASGFRDVRMGHPAEKPRTGKPGSRQRFLTTSLNRKPGRSAERPTPYLFVRN